MKIERLKPRGGIPEEPFETPRGYKLANPKYGDEIHHGKHAVYVKSLKEAADLIDQGYSIWMTRKGFRPSLISPASLRIKR